VSADVGQTLAIFVDIEEPRRTPQRGSGDQLHDVMDAARAHRRFPRAAGFEGAEHVAVVDELALQLAGHLVALGHDVVGREVVAPGQRQRFFELPQIGRGDDPRLIGEHVQARLQGGQDAIDLAAIAAGKHHDVAGAIAQQLRHGVAAGVDVERPTGRIEGARVEQRDAVEIVQQVRSQRRIDGDARIHPGVHVFL
jgi:hypothetical protein